MALDAAVWSPIEATMVGAERDRLVAGVAGPVLEIGAGPGRTLRHYRSGARVIACEAGARWRGRLAGEARTAPVPVAVVAAGPRLPFPDASFPTAVCVFVVCAAADPGAVLVEVRRVLHPEGSLLFLEPTVGRRLLMAWVQRVAAPAWSRVSGGWRMDRDAVALLRAAGFVVADCERLAPGGWLTAGTLVRGRAILRREA